MSEFLMIVPSDWSELATASDFLDQQGEQQIVDLIARDEGWAAIEALLQDGGFIGPAEAIVDFRMFRDGTANRIWYKLG